VTPIRGVDFTENAKPLAQALAQTEVRRFKLHVALSAVHRALESGDVAVAKRAALLALEAERVNEETSA
jgi:tagatose-1,6-bisphosphate aldolase non-catalytic subunit AgaZ/GatZ